MDRAVDRALDLDAPAFGAASLPPTERLLSEGGDERIAVSGPHGSNRYGCRTAPEPGLAAFGSSTASTVSPSGFAAAERRRRALVEALGAASPAEVYRRGAEALKGELLDLLGLRPLAGVEVVLAASGTDLHLLLSQMIGAGETAPPLAIVGGGAETGRGAPIALSGQPFGPGSPFSRRPGALEPIEGAWPCEVAQIAGRTPEGAPRRPEDLDAEVSSLAQAALRTGRRVLLTLTDVSKTGLIFPSVACAMTLKAAHPQRVEVLVDACQLRLSPRTLQAYLRLGFLVAVTGSKFLGGPPFCGALLVPQGAAERFEDTAIPRGLCLYSARGDWPAHWAAGASLDAVANFGLLLRWSAALEELRAFAGLPEPAVADFLLRFGEAAREAFEQNPVLQPIPAAALDRGALGQAPCWDGLPTIFSFALRRPGRAGGFASPAEAALVQRIMRWKLPVAAEPDAPAPPAMDLAVELGQPVAFACVNGDTAAALRLSAGAPLVIEALCGPPGASERILDQARDVVAAAAWIARKALL